MMPTITQTGLRRTRIICRWKISQMSRSSFTWIPSFLAQRAAGLGQEHVVEARPVQLDRAEGQARAVERAQDLRDRGRAGVHVQPQAVVDRLQLAHVRLAVEQLRRARAGAVEAHRDHVAGHLPLQRVGGTLGDDLPVVDDRDPVVEGVGFLEVVRGDEDRHALSAQPADLLPHVRPALRVQPGRRLVEEDDLRLVDDAERHVDAAALPAGVGLALAVGELGPLEALDGLRGQLARLRLADAVEPGLQYQFFARGHGVPRAAALGHVPDPPAYLTRAPP